MDDFKNSVFDNNGEYRWAASSKLLQLLGYGRFDYQNRSYTDFSDQSVSGISHLPKVSIFRLLAYHKICNDHYQFRQWQGYDASLCNVDYITPSGSMDLSAQFEQVNFVTGKNADRCYRDWETDRKSTRLNSSHRSLSRMPSSA